MLIQLLLSLIKFIREILVSIWPYFYFEFPVFKLAYC
jgi:hypothetical protein